MRVFQSPLIKARLQTIDIAKVKRCLEIIRNI